MWPCESSERAVKWGQGKCKAGAGWCDLTSMSEMADCSAQDQLIQWFWRWMSPCSNRRTNAVFVAWLNCRHTMPGTHVVQNKNSKRETVDQCLDVQLSCKKQSQVE